MIMSPIRLILFIVVSMMLIFVNEGWPLSFPPRNPPKTKCPLGYRIIRTGGCRKVIASSPPVNKSKSILILLF